MESQEESKTNTSDKSLTERMSQTMYTEPSRELPPEENTREIGRKALEVLQKGHLERLAAREKEAKLREQRLQARPESEEA